MRKQNKKKLYDSSAFCLPSVITCLRFLFSFVQNLFKILIRPEPLKVAAFPHDQTLSPSITGCDFIMDRSIAEHLLTGRAEDSPLRYPE